MTPLTYDQKPDNAAKTNIAQGFFSSLEDRCPVKQWARYTSILLYHFFLSEIRDHIGSAFNIKCSSIFLDCRALVQTIAR